MSLNLTEIKTLQFELWQECNNKCDFCYLNVNNRFTADDIKVQSLKNTYEKISDLSNYKEYNCIGYIGGEFFQGQLKNPEVKQWFYKLMDKTAELYNSKIISSVWISATLTIGHQEDLYNILNKFNNHSNIWIITSWDSIGRFKTEKMKKNWEFHIQHLREVFPELKINTTIILTEDLIDRYLNGELVFTEFSKQYNTALFFKQCGSLVASKVFTVEDQMQAKIASNKILPRFFPPRNKFIKFLIKFKNQETADMWTRLFNIQYRADNLIRNYNDGHKTSSKRYKGSVMEVNEDGHLNCGHPLSYAAYIDCDNCVLCDAHRIAEFDN